MKKFTYILVTVAVCMVGLVQAQSSDWTIRQVRDPVQHQEKLNVDGAAVDTRLDALEVGIGTNVTLLVTVGGLTTTGAVTIAEGALADSTVVTADVKDGTLVNADLNAAAAIAQSKVATNSIGARAITFTSTLCTNVLVFNAQGILSSVTNSP